MLRLIRMNSYIRHFRNYCPLQMCFRTFLSESYSCTEAWKCRYESSLLSKVNPNNLYLELDQKLQSSGKISAVDVDIFINTVHDPNFIDEVLNIIHQLRLTAETSNTLESTHYAFIRYLLDSGHEELLLEVLHDRLNYGIFPDHYCCNLIMDNFIKKKDFVSAAKVATLLMLQEDVENNLSNALGIYSCYKYMERPDDWTLPTQSAINSDEEVTKVRVRYLRNPYFDDHFDLSEPKHLVGKSLVFFGKLFHDPLGRTCLLRGYISWLKYKKAAEVIKGWVDQGIDEIVYKEVIPLIEEEISQLVEDKLTDDVKELKIQLEKLKKSNLKDGCVTDEMEKQLQKIVEEKEATDIANQCQNYVSWEKKRMDLLEKQLNQLDKKTRLENIQKLKCDLQKRERLLTFFDHEEEIELRIEQKLALEEAKYGPRLQVTADIEDNYIPPEITKSNNSKWK